MVKYKELYLKEVEKVNVLRDKYLNNANWFYWEKEKNKKLEESIYYLRKKIFKSIEHKASQYRESQIINGVDFNGK
jgi:hypothetical protein